MALRKIDSSFITPEEYLEGEESAEVRHEYVCGRVYAMSGGTRNHNVIAGNIFARLHGALSGPCRPFINDIKVHVQTMSDDAYYYPDVVVDCSSADGSSVAAEEPSVIFEVLSESTLRVDEREKFLAYTSLDSLQEYVLVSQTKREVRVARRSSGWQIERYEGEEFEIELSCSDETLKSSEIYAGMVFG